MGDYPSNFATDLKGMQNCLERLKQLEESLAAAPRELSDIAVEWEHYLRQNQHLHLEPPTMRMREAYELMMRALSRIEEARLIMEEQQEAVEKSSEIVVYGLPPWHPFDRLQN